MLRSAKPDLYWVGVRLPFADRDPTRPLPMTLLVASESLAGGGLFVDYTPWLVLGATTLFVVPRSMPMTGSRSAIVRSA